MKKHGIRWQLMTLCVFSIAALIVTVSMISIAYSRSLLSNSERYVEKVTDQFQSELTSNLTAIDQMVNTLSIHSSVINYLSAPEGSAQKARWAEDLHEYYRNLKSLQPAVVDISAFRTDFGCSTYYNFINALPLLDKLEGRVHSVCLGVADLGPPYYKLILNGCTVLKKNLKSGEMEPLGTLVMASDPKILCSKLAELSDLNNIHYMVYDSSRELVVGNVDDQDGKILTLIQRIIVGRDAVIDDGHYRVRSAFIPKLGGQLVTVIDKELLFRPVGSAVMKSVWILLATTVILFGLYLISVRSIVRPLDRITAFLIKLRSGGRKQWEERIPVEGNRDTVLLSMEFNRMFERINTLTEELIVKNTRLYQAQLMAKQSEITLLRSQINPHFLYNTLEVLRSIGILRGVPEVASVSKALAKILRYSIKGYANVSLREELAIVDNYIRIQNVRFRGKIRLEWNVPENLVDCQIPKMCLQPIVENAVVHGLESLPEGGTLRVTAFQKEEETLIVTISDNGIGMEKSRVEDLERRLREPCNPSEESYYGLGLINSNLRIRLTQGPSYGLSVDSSPGAGTTVTVRFAMGAKDS